MKIKIELTQEEEEQETNEEEPILQRSHLQGCKKILDEIQNNNKEE